MGGSPPLRKTPCLRIAATGRTQKKSPAEAGDSKCGSVRKRYVSLAWPTPKPHPV